jgi:hypothetical protein
MPTGEAFPFPRSRHIRIDTGDRRPRTAALSISHRLLFWRCPPVCRCSNIADLGPRGNDCAGVGMAYATASRQRGGLRRGFVDVSRIAASFPGAGTRQPHRPAGRAACARFTACGVLPDGLPDNEIVYHGRSAAVEAPFPHLPAAFRSSA